MAVVAFDARDAFLPMPHGSGIYVRCLFEALQRVGLGEHELWPLRSGGRGPEAWFEQVTLPRQLKARGAALIHSPDTFLPLRRPCPGVVTIHDLGFEEISGEIQGATGLKYRTLVPRAARSAQRVICPSRFTAEDVVRRYGVDVDRIRVIPEAAALAEGTLPVPEGPYLLAAGDLRPKKNLSALIDAYGKLRRRGLAHRLILAGADAGMSAALAAQAGEYPIEFPGFVSDAQLDALLRGADALVVPSLYEGFGLIVLDAMVRGCPVLAARAGALPETVGDAALLFDPFDTAELAVTLELVLEDQSERARLADAGRAHAATFSWDAAARATVAVYEELL